MNAAQLIVTTLLAATVGIASAEGPVNYPDEGQDHATPAVSAKTRGEVNAELAEARRLGLIAYGEVNDNVATPAASAKTRAQVDAELAEARRLGLITYGEVNDKVATPEQEKLIADAGRRAVLKFVAER